VVTHDGDGDDRPIYNKVTKGKGRGKGNKPKPRGSELAYLQAVLGCIPEDAESVRSGSTLKVPLRLGPDPNTEIGRQAIRERKGFLPWLREQHVREDDIGELACALQRHEAGGCDGADPPTGWVQLASRINRQIITSDAGRVRLRAAIDRARAEFRALPEEPGTSDGSAAPDESEFRVAAE